MRSNDELLKLVRRLKSHYGEDWGGQDGWIDE